MPKKRFMEEIIKILEEINNRKLECEISDGLICEFLEKHR
jgi:hypothetical protein